MPAVFDILPIDRFPLFDCMPFTDMSTGTSETAEPLSPTRGVLLVNLGTPDDLTTTAVRRFLAEFLSDPYVIRLPRLLRWLNPILGHGIGLFRARHALEMYEQIWTPHGSPLRITLESQRSGLTDRLGTDWKVYAAMRYGQPSIADRLAQITRDQIDELVVIPLYPQYSRGTTGSVIRQIADWIAANDPHFRLHLLSAWPDEQGYVSAQASLLTSTVAQQHWTPHDSYLVFSAHSIPVSHVRAGDPYPQHVERSASAIAAALDWPKNRYLIAYQSRFGPTEWLTPATDEAAAELLEAGEKRIVVCPLSFTADCLETLEELGVRLAEQIESAGGTMALCPAINATPQFLDALADWSKREMLHDQRPPRPFKSTTTAIES